MFAWSLAAMASQATTTLLNTILDEAVADYGKDFEVRLVSSLACARVEADPLRGLDDRACVALEKLLAKSSDVQARSTHGLSAAAS